MLLKFFKYGKGSVSCAINYLLKNSDNEAKKVVRGNSDLTQSIVDSISAENKYKSGVLSFEETDISSSAKEDIMDLFESTVFAGMDADDRNILWVQHQDKKRLELHFVIPRIHLSSEKAFNPYYHKIDSERVDTFKNYVNLKYALSDPNDPMKSRTHSYGNNPKLNLPEKTTKDELSRELYNIVVQLNISNRTQLIKLLKDSGYEITRLGKEYLSIKASSMKKAMRFRGGIFNESFTSVRALEEEHKEKITSYEQRGLQNLPRRLAKLEQTLDQLNRAKSIYNKKRYHYHHHQDFNTTDNTELSIRDVDNVSDKSEQNTKSTNMGDSFSSTNGNRQSIFSENSRRYTQYEKWNNQTLQIGEVDESEDDSYCNTYKRITERREKRSFAYEKARKSRRSLYEKSRATRNSSYQLFKDARGTVHSGFAEIITRQRNTFIEQATEGLRVIASKLKSVVSNITSKYQINKSENLNSTLHRRSR